MKKGEDGTDARPVLVGEALLSSPGVFLQFITKQKVAKIFGKTQFGIGVAAGPETMVGIANALIKLYPNELFLALDVINAFGEISRGEIFEEVLKELPELALFLTLLWSNCGTPVFIADSDSTWAWIFVADGLYQGHSLSSLLFRLGLRRAFEKV